MNSQPKILRGKETAKIFTVILAKKPTNQTCIINMIYQYAKDQRIGFYACLQEFFLQGQAEILALREKASRVEGWVTDAGNHLETMRANMPQPVAQPNPLTTLAAALKIVPAPNIEEPFVPLSFIHKEFREEAMALIKLAAEEIRKKKATVAA